MKFAFPRQRECHKLKRDLLSPDDFNTSVDLVQLKKEKLRKDKENLMASARAPNAYFLQGQSDIFHQLGSEQLSAVNSRNDHERSLALNSASTMPEGFMAHNVDKGNFLAESSI